jgi:hypothetical protein
MKATHWLGAAAFVAAVLAAGCSTIEIGGEEDSSASPASTAPSMSVPRATPENEARFMDRTSFVYGIGTNPEKMLEYGYDLCEAYAKYDGPRADVIRNWALENNEPLARASTLGAPATDHLCPE